MKEDAIRTTCPYCGVGCGVLATSGNDGVRIKGDPDHPANFGRLCSKGTALGETLGFEGRLLHPEVRGERASWDDALTLVADTFKQIIAENGPDSVGFYLSGQMLTEDYYVANKLMKGFIGTANVDTNSRLCMASTVVGHKRAFGADIVPGCYEDLELADLVILVGSNMAWCHPVLFQRLQAAKAERPHMKIVLIDPRRTKTAEMADLHLAIAPDGDVALFNGLLQNLADQGQLDQDYIDRHTNNFDKALAAAKMSTATLCTKTDLSIDQLSRFYQLFAESKKVVTCFSQGVNQSSEGTNKVNAIINCHLATGRIGKPGAGPFSLTGQPNAMGGREVGGLATMLAAHMEIGNELHRGLVQRFWQSPHIAAAQGMKAVDMFDALAKGKIKAIWVMGTNPVVSMPAANKVADALANCPFVVVSDILADTETARFAQVKLPALGWGEKDGTVTNSERCISRQRAFLPAPGRARPDWWQMAEVAKRMGYDAAFEYQSARDIFAEHAALSAFQNEGERDFDIGAFADISDVDYDELQPTQWPRRKGQKAVSQRFFAGGHFFTPDGRANFVATPATPETQATVPSTLRLNTGRVRDHWHTMTRTGKSAALSAHIAEPFCEVSPEQASKIGVRPAELVEITTEGHSVLARAILNPHLSDDQIFVPMHWNGNFSSNGRINALVCDQTDPFSGQPALKGAQVKLRSAQMGLYGFMVSQAAPEALSSSYWAKAITNNGWRVDLAQKDVAGDIEKTVRAMCGWEVAAADVHYHDATTGQHRLAWFEGPQLQCALFLAPEPVAVSRAWAVGQLAKEFESPAERYRLLAGRPGKDMPDPGPIVCSCFSVGANQIADAVRNGSVSVAAIGEKLSAGTNCGSCKPEISEFINEFTLSVAQ
ncbi:nitrate reductase [Maritalea mediterranea]|uniref:Nitrate reductase n=1 Tax=Maritalea mediterranea TaxID=2909667 RepID=A0ABS9E7E9_9HYPH|nr:nitrate reductase [Maritalea mediterranea]MCF4098122.1 nitrate reductase [Maritalea mediterranea]